MGHARAAHFYLTLAGRSRPRLRTMAMQRGDMKPFALCVVWIACSSGIAQDQTDSGERWACLTSSKCLRTRDARSDAQEFARTAKVGAYWAEGRGSIAATFATNHIESSGDRFQLRGNVEINTNILILRADGADGPLGYRRD